MLPKTFKPILAALPLAILAACGSDSAPSVVNNHTGTLSVAVTDAPVDSATQVVVTFTGISVKPASANEEVENEDDSDVIEFHFDEPRSIDLLELQGHVSEYLLTEAELEAGDYSWLRLHVLAEWDGVMDSYIELEDGTQHELRVPSGAQTGLKLVGGFTIVEDTATDLTIDFDLRKSVIMPPAEQVGGAILRPALRMVNTDETGAIEGEISALLFAEKCADPDAKPAVFVFPEGTPANEASGAADDALASALVRYKNGAHRFEVGFLPEAAYDLAFTCDAQLDIPGEPSAMRFVPIEEPIVVEARGHVLMEFRPGLDIPPMPVPPADGLGNKPETPNDSEEEELEEDEEA